MGLSTGNTIMTNTFHAKETYSPQMGIKGHRVTWTIKYFSKEKSKS